MLSIYRFSSKIKYSHSLCYCYRLFVIFSCLFNLYRLMFQPPQELQVTLVRQRLQMGPAQDNGIKNAQGKVAE